MAIIPNNFVNAVVAIGVQQQCNGHREKLWIGTGFLVSMQEPNNMQVSTIYLITNKHVLNGKNTVYVRFNSVVGAFAKDYEIQLIDGMGRKSYTEHPDAEVDIIAIQLNPQCLINDSSIWGAINIDTEALDVHNMKIHGIDEGWLVYALGFPMSLVSEIKTPICRMGCISRLMDVFLQPDRAKYFLVDAQAFPGNSGGPIISKPESAYSTVGTNYIPARLLGVLSAYIPYRDALISQQTQEIKMVQTENSGLTIVYPVDRIKEVVLLDWDRHREDTINNFGTYIGINTENGQG
ncbi:MAG: serine protease [Lachnospiraceae bacterium]|nr:serine protease [Lachnospiraceae bacterium]